MRVVRVQKRKGRRENEYFESIPDNDAARISVQLVDLDDDRVSKLGSSKYDPALMDWDAASDESEYGELEPIDDGGLARPTIVLFGREPWSRPRPGPCPVCRGRDETLDSGPPSRAYCGYCDRYGLDTVATRRATARNHAAQCKPTAAKRREPKREK